MTYFHDYIERCPQCGQYLTAEQVKIHKCTTLFKGVKEIPILYHFEIKDDNGQTIIMARGSDSILYRLRLGKNIIRRKFTGNKSDEDLTEPRSA